MERCLPWFLCIVCSLSLFLFIFPTLCSVAEDLRTPGKVPVEKFIIHKNLTKDPEAYADKKSQPHVLVSHSRRQNNRTRKEKKERDTGLRPEWNVFRDGTKSE